jgi:hypothetical protein
MAIPKEPAFDAGIISVALIMGFDYLMRVEYKISKCSGFLQQLIKIPAEHSCGSSYV